MSVLAALDPGSVHASLVAVHEGSAPLTLAADPVAIHVDAKAPEGAAGAIVAALVALGAARLVVEGTGPGAREWAPAAETPVETARKASAIATARVTMTWVLADVRSECRRLGIAVDFVPRTRVAARLARHVGAGDSEVRDALASLYEPASLALLTDVHARDAAALAAYVCLPPVAPKPRKRAARRKGTVTCPAAAEPANATPAPLSPLALRLLDLLRAPPLRPHRLDVLCVRAAVARPATVRDALTEGIERGMVTQPERGKYQIAPA